MTVQQDVTVSQPDYLCKLVEPGFSHPQIDYSSVSVGYPWQKVLTFLNYSLTKTPGNITLHVQKIKLLQAAKFTNDQLLAAIIDLFTVLKQCGFELRKRLLISSRNQVSKTIFKHLSKHLKNCQINLNESWIKNLPCICLPVLKADYIVIHTKEQVESDSRQLEDIVNSFIENGQLEAAMDTLEKSLLDNLLNENIHHILVELYLDVSQKDRFQLFYLKFKKLTNNNLPACWEEAKSSF